MNIIADTHVHLYPCYDLERAFQIMRTNLTRLAPNHIQMGLMAERHDCRFFQGIVNGTLKISHAPVELSGYGEAVRIREEGYNDLYLFAGRQIISKERLEVLALTTDTTIPDGLPVRDAIGRIHDCGAVAVLSWAPGKWFSRRGEIVSRLLDDHSPGELLLGDTTLRPWCWLEPRLMKKGRESGFSVLAGSDPLPFVGEERMIGRYGSEWRMQGDLQDPVASVREFLKQTDHSPVKIGSRCSGLTTARRILKNYQVK